MKQKKSSPFLPESSVARRGRRRKSQVRVNTFHVRHVSIPHCRHRVTDLEDGLFPGISPIDNMLRLGFIRKVFGIVSVQLLLTASVALAIASSRTAQTFLFSSPWIYYGLSLASILALLPLFKVKDTWPYNILALGLWTCLLGVSVGITITFYSKVVVGQAVMLTGCIVGALSAYSFYATKKGVSFGWMGPMLLSSLIALVISSILLLFFHSPVAETVYSLFGALIFSGYIVYDIHLLAAKFDVDEYIWASVCLYLDIINLFLHILRLLGNGRERN